MRSFPVAQSAQRDRLTPFGFLEGGFALQVVGAIELHHPSVLTR